MRLRDIFEPCLSRACLAPWLAAMCRGEGASMGLEGESFREGRRRLSRSRGSKEESRLPQSRLSRAPLAVLSRDMDIAECSVGEWPGALGVGDGGKDRAALRQG